MQQQQPRELLFTQRQQQKQPLKSILKKDREPVVDVTFEQSQSWPSSLLSQTSTSANTTNTATANNEKTPLLGFWRTAITSAAVDVAEAAATVAGTPPPTTPPSRTPPSQQAYLLHSTHVIPMDCHLARTRRKHQYNSPEQATQAGVAILFLLVLLLVLFILVLLFAVERKS